MFDGKDDLKAEYRRVEVLTGPGRRRRWSVEDKARIVAEAMAPGAVVSEVARRWQLSSQQVFGWRREACAGLLALPADGTVASLPVPDFVPILAGPAVSAAAPAPAQDAALVPAIEVEMAGAVVRVRPGMDAGLLASVLRAVRASAGGA
jgi:transposase